MANLGKEFKEHTDFLKNVMNIIVLVTGAVGSIVNLVKGNNLPMILSLVAVAVVIVCIVAEWKSRREHRGEFEARDKKASVTQEETQGASIPYPLVVRPGDSPGGERLYRQADGRIIVRLVAPRSMTKSGNCE